MELRTSDHKNLASHLKPYGLISLRADSDALGLDLAGCLEMEKTDPSRAYIQLKVMVGKRISATSSICELRALNKLWDNIRAVQSYALQAKKTSSLGCFKSQSNLNSNQSRITH